MRKALIQASMNTRNAEGTIRGSVMLNACWRKDAPSSVAYSYKGSGMDWSAATNMTMQKPRFFHRNISMIGTRSAALSSHITRSTPSAFRK